MSKVDEVRAELGEDNVFELMDAYYTSGLSLKDLKELFDIPQSFTDEKILQLFPPVELDDSCPLCGGALQASRISRRIRGASQDSYYPHQALCANCDKTKQEALQEAKEREWVDRLRQAYSDEPKEFDWHLYNPDSLMDVAFEVLIATKGHCEAGYITPVIEGPLALGFVDCCRAIRHAGYIAPSAAFDKWLDGFEEEDDGLVFYWYRVPFLIDVANYVPLAGKRVYVEGDREFVELGNGEREYWLRTAKVLVMSFLDDQMRHENYECEGPKRDELEELLDTMLLDYSPAQITSLIWSAMAVAKKQADEGPDYKRNGNWAMGVILNRAKRALADRWEIRPNMPSLSIVDTDFEWHFFDVHVPIGNTWMYRAVPELIGGKVEIMRATMPKGTNAASAAMIAKARKIATKIGLDEPDYLSYDKTEQFINMHERRYKTF